MMTYMKHVTSVSTIDGNEYAFAIIFFHFLEIRLKCALDLDVNLA